ncbi:hypothetical protein [Massilia sp. HP4]|uniref:hypothetical protein n=1 Tax=Massilia sp. HP4 TaxID=2562316 RepID=UPI0010C0845D|nr:hypothetical protein [Massilia sp. HP4]
MPCSSRSQCGRRIENGGRCRSVQRRAGDAQARRPCRKKDVFHYTLDRWRAYVQLDNATDRRYISSYAIRNRSGINDSVFLPGNGRSLLAGVHYHHYQF